MFCRAGDGERSLQAFSGFRDQVRTITVLHDQMTAAPKPTNAPIDLAFVDQFCERIDTLDYTRLTAEQKTALNISFGKLRGVAYQKMKLLK